PHQDATAFRRQRVEAAPPLASLLHPAAAQPAALFEAVEERVERGDVEFQLALRLRLDQLADFVAVALALLDDRQDDQLRRPLLQLPLEHPAAYIWHSYRCHSQSIRRTRRKILRARHIQREVRKSGAIRRAAP